MKTRGTLLAVLLSGGAVWLVARGTGSSSQEAGFFSDWSTGEYTDGGRWKSESMWVSETSLPVVDGALQLRATNDLDSWLQLRSATTSLRLPAPGETITWSWRMRVTQEGSRVPDRLTHGIGWGSMGVPNDFAVMYFYTEPGRWRPELYVAAPDGRPFAWSRDPDDAWSHQLTADVWYDISVGFERTGADTYRPTIEIRETDGTLVASTPDFYDWPLRGRAAARSLVGVEITGGQARAPVELVGFLNGLADQPGPVTWGAIDRVSAEIR